MKTQIRREPIAGLLAGLLLLFPASGWLAASAASSALNSPAPAIQNPLPPHDLCGPGSNYTYTSGTGALVAGTTDSGNHCTDCTTPINLPFPVTLYDGTFNLAFASANGRLSFQGNDPSGANTCRSISSNSCPR